MTRHRRFDIAERPPPAPQICLVRVSSTTMATKHKIRSGTCQSEMASNLAMSLASMPPLQYNPPVESYYSLQVFRGPPTLQHLEPILAPVSGPGPLD